jgi:hypothetical protein
VRGGIESQRKREGERERGRERETRDERERESGVGGQDEKNRLQWNASCACYLIKLDSIVQHSIRTTQQNPHSSSIKLVPTMI